LPNGPPRATPDRAKARTVAEQLERIDFTAYAREIEQRLRAQRRRVERMLLIAQTQNA
jgi:hypothetical protein